MITGLNGPIGDLFDPSTMDNGNGQDLIGWGSLGFGAFRAFRSKRVNAMTLALMIFGMWRLGMISNIIPQDKDGNINWVMIGIAAFLPPTAAALVGGAPALVISVLSRTLWKRRKRYRRRFRSYRRRFFKRWRR